MKKAMRATWFIYVALVALAFASDLAVLDAFDVRYDNTMPVTSLSQQFTNLDAMTWVETAVPLGVPEGKEWDVRAMRFDILIGRRETSDSSGGFRFDWDSTPLLLKHGARLHLYASCDSDIHATGKPCPQPAAVYNAKLQTSSVALIYNKTWGSVYRTDVFLSRDPNTPGFLAHKRVWASFFATMPSRYTDPANGRLYDVKCWMAVGASTSIETDLAIADHADLLGRGWTDWRHGQELSHSLYQGTQYPSPGFSVVGYESDYDSSKPVATTPPSVPVNGTNHWPSGLPPPSPNPVHGEPPLSPTVIGFLAGGGGLFICALLSCGGFFVYGLRRRALKRAERKRDMENMYDVDNTQEALLKQRSRMAINDKDGSYVNLDESQRPRTSTDQSSASPLLIPHSLDNPYNPSPQHLTADDDYSDEFT